MTGWKQYMLRARVALDRLSWGLGAIRRTLADRGFWPARAISAITVGGERVWIQDTQVLPRSGREKADGLVVPEVHCLSGELHLPGLLWSELDAAVKESLWRLSPLPPDQVSYAWDAAPSVESGWRVSWLMCRRSAEQDMLAHQGLAADAPVYLRHLGRAFLARGTAWESQHKRQRRADGLAGAGLVLVLAMLLAPALIPLALKHRAVAQALQHVQALETQAAPLRLQLDELRNQALLGDELSKSVDVDLPLASLVEQLSAALPDDAWLDRIEVNGREVRMTGLTGNANELLAQLGRQPGLADARAAGANVRDTGLNKERFTFEMRWRTDGVRP